MRPTSAFISGMATMGILAGGIVLGNGIGQGTTANTTSATDQPETNRGVADSGVTDGTFTGDVVDTRYGPMQVEIVIANGAIESAKTLQQPGSDNESVQINAQVIPILIKATTEYQSVRFGNVSRATISTEAYKKSAQSALDQAGFTG